MTDCVIVAGDPDAAGDAGGVGLDAAAAMWLTHSMHIQLGSKTRLAVI